MMSLNRGHIQKLYNMVMKIYPSVAKLTKIVMKSALPYAVLRNLIKTNIAENIELPKNIKKKDFHTQKIDIQKTLTIEQVKILIEGSKGSKIYLQVLFGVLMGLRRGEINGFKYSDVDYVYRKLKVQRQLGIVPKSKKEDFKKKTFTKQEIELKTYSSYRELDIPDIVFEAILEQRKEYKRVKNRWKNYFQDLDFICCSMYGRPRSKNYNWQHFKKILAKNNLPNIRWHDLRATYSTLLMKNDFSVKAISKLMGHSKEIITADIYGDTPEIIADCL